MSNKFYEDEARPIVSAWVEQGYEIDRGFILEAIENDVKDLSTDTMIGGVAAFGSIASGCLMLALAGFTAPMIIPVVALVGSGLVAWNSDCSKGDRELESRFLKEYPAIFDRLAQKVSEGERVHTIAAEYSQMFRSYVRHDRTALAQLTSSSGNTPSIQNPVLEQVPEVSVGSHTLNSPETLANTVLEPVLPCDYLSEPVSEVAKPSSQHIVSPVWNPALDLGEHPQSVLIVGTPGSGKGMLVSNAIRVLKGKVPNLTVMMIDPKGDPKEKGYWASVTNIFESFALMDCLDPDEGAQWLLDCMAKFQKLPAPKLLIFDELLAASIELELADKSMKATQRLKKFMAGIVAQGDSKGVYVWAMSQSPQCADLGLNGGVRGNLRVIAIVSPKNKTAIQVITSTKLVPMVDGGMDELDKIMDSSPVGRAVFDGKIARWLPMPKLENHSGFDRDSRKLGDEVVTVQPLPKTIDVKSEPVELFENKLEPQSKVTLLNEDLAITEPSNNWELDSNEVTTKSTYGEWMDYPVHQAILIYLQGKTYKTDRNVYDSIKKKIDSSQWESIPGTDNMAKLKNVLSYLTSTKRVAKISDNSYSAID